MIQTRRRVLMIVSLIAIALPPQNGFTQQSAPTVLIGATLIDGTGRAAIADSVIVISRQRECHQCRRQVRHTGTSRQPHP